MGKKTKQMNDHDKTKGLIDTESKEAAERGGGKGKGDRRVRGGENANCLVVYAQWNITQP